MVVFSTCTMVNYAYLVTTRFRNASHRYFVVQTRLFVFLPGGFVLGLTLTVLLTWVTDMIGGDELNVIEGALVN